MNRLPGILVSVETEGSIALLRAEVGPCTCTAMLVGAADEVRAWQPGIRVTLLFKETEVSLAKNLTGQISLRNRLPARIVEITRGKLLTNVVLEFAGHRIESVITTRAAIALELATGDTIEALVKSNEMTMAPDAS
jgi:molybdate transport system regulatory protein